MELGRDPPSLVVGCLDRTDEQRLPLRLGAAESAVEARCEGHLDDPEDDEASEEKRSERHPDAAAARRDGAPALVGLEQERRSVGGPDRQVDLVQIALPALVSVLGACEIAQRRLGGPRPQHVELLSVEGEPCTDEARLVRVHDAPVARPELHPDDPRAEHALLDDPVDDRDRLWLASQKAGCDRRLDDPLAGQRGELPRVAERLGVRQAA